MLSSKVCPDSSGKSRTAGKIFIQTLFLFLLVTQICFGQWIPLGPMHKSIKNIAVRDSNIFAVNNNLGEYNGEVYRSTDNGMNWTTIVDSNAVDVAISPSGIVFMIKDTSQGYSPNSALFFSTDNGDTWVKSNIMEQLIDSIPTGWPRNITVSPSGMVFCGVQIPAAFGGLQYVLTKSTDDGLNWTTPGVGVIGGNLFDFKGPYVLTEGNIFGGCGYGEYLYLSSDFGSTWNYTGYPPTVITNTIGLFPNGNILAGGWMNGTGQRAIFISTNSCSTWTQTASINCQIGLSWSIGFSEGMLVGTEDSGVSLFSDEGDSLGSWNDGLSGSWVVLTLTQDNNGFVYLGEDANIIFGSGGVWKRPLSDILPVELTSFTATANGNEVILSWSTATELNNLGFEVQRSSGGEEFLTVGFVKGSGTSSEQHNYTFSDRNLNNGNCFYRLKQVDFNGSYEYSDVIEVEWRAFNSYLLEQNYPNPFNPVTTIGYGMQEKSNVKITILNIIGEEVAVILNEEKEAGYHQVEFNASALPSGVYFYQLQAGSYIDTKKMILLK